jgi:hypothetical protein
VAKSTIVTAPGPKRLLPGIIMPRLEVRQYWKKFYLMSLENIKFLSTKTANHTGIFRQTNFGLLG